jgi:hypothetical protein
MSSVMSGGRTAHSPLALAAALAAAVGAASFAGCRDPSPPPPSEDETLGQRVFAPPPRIVRAVPPYRIQPGGLGPYAIGAELKDILNTLPHGPRIELLQIERLVSYRLVRVEQDTVLVGIGQDGRVSFIAVLEPGIAKTEGGLGVGSDIARLRDGLGPERRLAGARDPRLVDLERLPGARVLVERERVVAIVVGPDGREGAQDLGQADALSGGESPGAERDSAGRTLSAAPPRQSAPTSSTGPGCTATSASEALVDEPVAQVARLDDAEDGAVHYGCFTGSEPEAVVEGNDQLVLVVGEPGRLRRAAALSVPGLLFASQSDSDGDGRHELVAVSEQRTSDALAVRVEVLRGEGSRLVGAGADEVYRVTSGAAAPVGAKLKDMSLLIEAYAAPEALEVSGFYLHEVAGKVRSVAPLLPKTIPLRPRRRTDAGGPSVGPAIGPATRGAGARGLRSSTSDRKGAPEPE